MGVVTLPPELVSTLVEAVGPTHVLTGADETAGWTVDWTGRFVGRTPAVVRPGSVDEVAAVLRACAAEGVGVVPQGGNTGLVGGSVPLEGEVVLSLRRLDAVGQVDHAAGQVTAGAGVTIAGLDRRARAAGLAYGVDFAARDSATVGGSIATNAGGVRFCRHGGTRQQLLGVEAVLGDGSIISHLVGLEKDNTGYDLAGLLCGSEGTLGVVTAARLRLVARADERVVALLAFDGPDAIALAIDAVRWLRRALGAIDAAELFLHDGLALAVEMFGLSGPFTAPHAAYLLVERADAEDPTAALAAAVDGLDGVADVAVATDARRRADLWRYREAHTEAINALGVPHKLDVTLPVGTLAGFVAQVGPAVAAVAAGARTYLFGHAADGNVHVNVVGPPIDDDRVDDVVLSLVIELGGSISAEHGIGTAKKAWLHRSRSSAELAAMRALKQALDPTGILNPNVLLPPP
jgi:FAD/FMN-containing dehydrogenase